MIVIFPLSASTLSLKFNTILALTATPVSYEASDVLKCSVSFNYIRYVKEIRTTSSIAAIENQRSRIDSLINVDPFSAS